MKGPNTGDKSLVIEIVRTDLIIEIEIVGGTVIIFANDILLLTTITSTSLIVEQTSNVIKKETYIRNIGVQVNNDNIIIVEPGRCTSEEEFYAFKNKWKIIK